jgi:two-component system LytT family response regulator
MPDWSPPSPDELKRRSAAALFLKVHDLDEDRIAGAAHELGALDYLLKPFGRERLTTATKRQGPLTRLCVRQAGGVVPIPVAAVAWFEARGDYVAAHVGPARHLLQVSLHRLEARLDPAKFLRVHRAHIVNLDHVRAFRRVGKGRLVADLRDGASVAVSRTHARDLRGLGT